MMSFRTIHCMASNLQPNKNFIFDNFRFTYHYLINHNFDSLSAAITPFCTLYHFQSWNRDIFEIIITTPTLIKCEVWLNITAATKCMFFATFWTYRSNLTVTSTLLTNYCKHSIHPSLQANTVFHLFSQHPFLSH